MYRVRKLGSPSICPGRWRGGRECVNAGRWMGYLTASTVVRWIQESSGILSHTGYSETPFWYMPESSRADQDCPWPFLGAIPSMLEIHSRFRRSSSFCTARHVSLVLRAVSVQRSDTRAGWLHNCIGSLGSPTKSDLAATSMACSLLHLFRPKCLSVALGRTETHITKAGETSSTALTRLAGLRLTGLKAGRSTAGGQSIRLLCVSV